MYFEEYGEKNSEKVVVFLHAAMAQRCFSKQIPLAKHFRCIFIHLYGHGQEAEKVFDREKLVKEIGEFVKDLSESGKEVEIVCFSLGSQIGISLLNDYYQYINKAVLVSLLVDSTKKDGEQLNKSMRRILKAGKLKYLRAIVAKIQGIPQADKERFYEETKKMRYEVVDEILQKMTSLSELDNLHKITTPIMLFCGSLETKSFKRSTRIMAKLLPNAKEVFYKLAGHTIPFLFADSFNERVREFIASGVEFEKIANHKIDSSEPMGGDDRLVFYDENDEQLAMF